MISDDIAEQTAQTFRNIEVLLEAAGASVDDVVSCLVHLADLSDYAALNMIYEKRFPARSLCEPLCELTWSPACSSRSRPSLEPPRE